MVGGVSLWLVLLGRLVVICVPWLVVGGYLCTFELVPWLVLLGIGWWLSVCLGACALVVRVPLVNNVPWLVVGGYLCTFELVPWWLLLGRFVVTCVPLSLCLGGSCWLEVITCMPWSLCLGGSCLGGWRLLVYLGACALVVGVSLVGGLRLLVPLVNVPWSLCLGGWCPW